MRSEENQCSEVTPEWVVLMILVHDSAAQLAGRRRRSFQESPPARNPTIMAQNRLKAIPGPCSVTRRNCPMNPLRCVLKNIEIVSIAHSTSKGDMLSSSSPPSLFLCRRPNRIVTAKFNARHLWNFDFRDGRSWERECRELLRLDSG